MALGDVPGDQADIRLSGGEAPTMIAERETPIARTVARRAGVLARTRRTQRLMEPRIPGDGYPFTPHS